jgi:DNA-binding MarR family transcriptional regulator
MNSRETKFSLGFIQLCTIVRETCNRLKNNFNLNENEVKLLIAVYSNEPDSVKEISEFLNLTPTLTSKILSSLEAKSLLTRQINKIDKRYEKIILTEEGIRITCLIIDFIEKSFSEKISEMFVNDREILLVFSEKIKEKIKDQSHLINNN